jgi:hypothetical protein
MGASCRLLPRCPYSRARHVRLTAQLLGYFIFVEREGRQCFFLAIASLPQEFISAPCRSRHCRADANDDGRTIPLAEASARTGQRNLCLRSRRGMQSSAAEFVRRLHSSRVNRAALPGDEVGCITRL